MEKTMEFTRNGITTINKKERGGWGGEKEKEEEISIH